MSLTPFSHKVVKISLDCRTYCKNAIEMLRLKQKIDDLDDTFFAGDTMHLKPKESIDVSVKDRLQKGGQHLDESKVDNENVSAGLDAIQVNIPT